jgi:hypothetical protein
MIGTELRPPYHLRERGANGDRALEVDRTLGQERRNSAPISRASASPSRAGKSSASAALRATGRLN